MKVLTDEILTECDAARGWLTIGACSLSAAAFATSVAGLETGHPWLQAPQLVLTTLACLASVPLAVVNVMDARQRRRCGADVPEWAPLLAALGPLTFNLSAFLYHVSWGRLPLHATPAPRPVAQPPAPQPAPSARIRVECPTCLAAASASIRIAGRSVRCAACSDRFVVQPPAGCVCQRCFRVADTIELSLTEHRGLFVAHEYRTVGGRLCRTCCEEVGAEVNRVNQSEGWWSPVGLFATPIALLANTSNLARAQAIAPPHPDAPVLESYARSAEVMRRRAPAVRVKLCAGYTPEQVADLYVRREGVRRADALMVAHQVRAELAEEARQKRGAFGLPF